MICKINKASEEFLLEMSRRGRLCIKTQIRDGRGKNARMVERTFMRQIKECDCGGFFCMCFTMKVAMWYMKSGNLYVKVNRLNGE